MKKIVHGSVKIPVALALLVAIVAIAASAIYVREANALRRGVSEGFRLDGVYRDHEPGLTSLSFHGEDGSRWQIVDSIGNATDGSFETTDDPNIFMLADKSGDEYGFAHLSYVSADGNQGSLYLNTGTSVIEFDKVSRDPAFVESSTCRYFYFL